MEEIESFLEDAIQSAERKLSANIGVRCAIRITLNMDEKLISTIQQIDNEKFRSELQYSIEELRERSQNSGFVLFIVVCDDSLLAFLYGYSDPLERSKFYLDTIATLVEGKGIGSILVYIALLYCYYIGYEAVELYTEDEDEKGKHLKGFYENLGFYKTSSDLRCGVGMRNDLDPITLRYLYQKYLRMENDEQGPFHHIHKPR